MNNAFYGNRKNKECNKESKLFVKIYLKAIEYQGDTYKLESCFAVWNGEDFELEIGSPREVIG